MRLISNAVKGCVEYVSSMEVAPERGVFIVFEGVDGAGKTTQSTGLATFLQRNGVQAIRSKEPTDGPWGMKIRHSAKNGRMSAEEEIHAFSEDRRAHVRDLIEPSLAAGKTVILDRYFYSTIAYQSVAGFDHDEITRRMTAEFPIPDVVILLDVPADIGLSRVVGRDTQANKFESLSNLTQVREAFAQIAREHANVIKIDGTSDAESVRYETTKQLLDGVLKKRYCGKIYGCDDILMCGVRMAGDCLWVNMNRDASLMRPETLRK